MKTCKRSCKVIAIIPARAGSKRLVKKNQREIGGVSLTLRAVRFAVEMKEMGYVDEVVLTTDDSKIRGEVVHLDELFGVRVIERNERLATDDATMYDVVVDALGDRDDKENTYVIILQPTSPFRIGGTFMEMFDKMLSYGYPGMITYNRNTLKPNGAFYIVRAKELLDEGTIWVDGVGVWLMDNVYNIDIDNIWDFRIADAYTRGALWKQ